MLLVITVSYQGCNLCAIFVHIDSASESEWDQWPLVLGQLHLTLGLTVVAVMSSVRGYKES